MGPRPIALLEVERKFLSLAVRPLTLNGGIPAFRSLRSLEPQTFRDIYYDNADGWLVSSGVWVRTRDSQWQAKVRKGGNFTNSRFEEVEGMQRVSVLVKRHLGFIDPYRKNWGLSPIADIETRRQTWIADDEFSIVVDDTDFGHSVGEVELQRELAYPTEREKQRALAEMDAKIEGFMERYSWAFTPGKPKGKLTAYFEMLNSKKSSSAKSS